MIGDFNNWVTGFVDWNLALDLHGGPLHVNFKVLDVFGSDSAVILDTNGPGHIYYQTIFNYIGHFSKFVPEGAQRIGWSLKNPSVPTKCNISLEKQKSSTQCVEGETFGCID